MAAAGGYDYVKLHRLAQAESLPQFTSGPPLTKLLDTDVPNYVTPTAESRAEQLLLSKKASKLYRAPSIRTKRRTESYDFKNVTAILPDAIRQNESAGIIQALLGKAGSALSVKNTTKRDDHIRQRDALLLLAVQSENVDLVWLLASETSQERRNEALDAALDLRNNAVSSKLLEYDADPNFCSQRFIAAASQGDHAVISLLLRAPRRIQREKLLDALTAAARSGSLHTFTLIAEAADLHCQQELQAALECIKAARLDMLYTLLLRAPSLSPPFLDGLVSATIHTSNLGVDTQSKITNALFYAGAFGERSAQALALAVENNATDLISVFAQHYVDINWNKGRAVRLAARTARSGLLDTLIASGRLSADNANRAMKNLPRHIDVDERLKMLKSLLDAGAYGATVDDQLTLAVQDGHQATITLLQERGASLDRNQGDALVESIKCGRVETLGILLRGSVGRTSMHNAFPHIRTANRSTRLQMTKLLLNARASGEAVNAALRDAVCDQSSDRDPDLINALIKGGADPTFNDAQALHQAIEMSDTDLLKDLLNCPAQVSQGIVSSLLSKITEIENNLVRYQMIHYAIQGHASTASVSGALVKELSRESVNVDIIDLLLSSGNISIDHDEGKSMVLAAVDLDLSILTKVSKCRNLSRSTITKGLVRMLQCTHYDDAQKASRAAVLLAGRTSQNTSSHGLQTYVNHCRASYHGGQWPLQTFRVLLDAHADVNTDRGNVFISVADAAVVPLLELMIERAPHEKVVDSALIHSVRLDNEGNRSDILEILLKSGPSVKGTSATMVEATQRKLLDVVRRLLAHGALVESQDHRSIRTAASQGPVELLKIFLESKPPRTSLVAAFEEATTLVNATVRLNVMREIVRAPFRHRLVDRYLIRLVGEDDTPVEMVQMLLDNNASVHEQQSQSVILAATMKKLEILKMLFSKVILAETVTHCFEACMAAGLIEAHDIPVLQFLLEMGATGPCLHQALVKAVENLPHRASNDTTFVELLVAHGADTSYADGVSLCRACEFGTLEAVKVLLRSNTSSRIKSRALHYLLESTASESVFCSILDCIMSSSSPNPDDPNFQARPTFAQTQEEFHPALRVLLKNRPRDSTALRRIFDSNCGISLRHNETDIVPWAMSQTDPKVSSSCIQVLIECGASLNYRNARSGETLVHLAMRTGHSSLINLLIKYHVEVCATSNDGCSPLFIASAYGNVRVMSDLLGAGLNPNDGSLHEAARNLKTEAVMMLLRHGYDPTHPSAMHGGRTALAELLLNGKARRSNYGAIAQIIALLCDAGSDVTRQVGRKPLICLALDNTDPVPMTEAALIACLHDKIDEDFNIFSDGHLCYSPTRYVSKGIFRGPPNAAGDLESLLRSYAKRDVYYNISTTQRQPPDAEGMPPHIKQLEIQRQEKEQKIADQEAEHQRWIRQANELEAQRQLIENQQHQLRLAQAAEAETQKLDLQQARLDQELAHQQKRADQERQAERAGAERRQQERLNELQYRTDVGNVETAAQRERLRLEADNRKGILFEEQKALEYRIGAQKRWARDQDSYDERHHERRMKELAMARAAPAGAPFLPPAPRMGFIEQ